MKTEKQKEKKKSKKKSQGTMKKRLTECMEFLLTWKPLELVE